MSSKILNFSPDRLITGINIVDNMMFYVDNQNEPKKINIEKFRGDATEGEFKEIPVDHSTGTTYIYNRPFEERDITVIKDHPINPITTVKYTENFGPEEEDLSIEEVEAGNSSGIDENSNVIENIEQGLATVQFAASFTYKTQFEGVLNKGNGTLTEAGFIWSHSESSLEGLINGVGNTSYEIESGDIGSGNSFVIINKIIQSTQSSHPTYDANLTSGDIYVVSFGKKKGLDSRFYSEVKKAKIKVDTVSCTAPSGLSSSFEIVGNEVNFTANLEDDGGEEIIQSGFYISKGAVNNNDGSPTIQELVNKGIKVLASANSDLDKITGSTEIEPNKIFYYIPFVTTKCGTVYGNSLTLVDTVDTGEVENKGEKKINVATSQAGTEAGGEYGYDGDIVKGTVLGHISQNNQPNGNPEITEVGFYIDTSGLTKEEIITSTFTNNSANGGKTIKYPATSTTLTPNVHKDGLDGGDDLEPNDFDYDKGGDFYLSTRNKIAYTAGQTFSVIAYAIDEDGNESVGEIITSIADIKSTGPKDVPLTSAEEPHWSSVYSGTKPTFGVANREYFFKDESTVGTVDADGIRTGLVSADIDVLSLGDIITYNVNPDGTYTTEGGINDIGFVFSAPVTDEEISGVNAQTGIFGVPHWEVNNNSANPPKTVDPNNTFRVVVGKDDFTFNQRYTDEGNPIPGGGTYELNNPVELYKTTNEMYNSLVENGYNPSALNLTYTPFIVDHTNRIHYGVTQYVSGPRNNFNPLHDISELGKNYPQRGILGATPVVNENSNSKTINDITDTTVTLLGKLSNHGKPVSEFGYYISNTEPSNITINNNGHSEGLDTWAATATKVVATNLTTAQANTHINQSTNPFIDFEVDVTGLTAETAYYIVPFSKPVQTTSNIGAEGPENGGQSLKEFVNRTKYGSIKEFSTNKAALTSVDVEPDVVILDISTKNDLTKTSVNLTGTAIKKSDNYAITKVGFYAKPATEFTNPFSDQAGNAATMASSTNRLEKEIILNNPFDAEVNEEDEFKAELTSLNTVEYYVASFVETNTNGNIETFISDYISVDNSVNTGTIYYGGGNFNQFQNTGMNAYVGTTSQNNYLRASLGFGDIDVIPQIINYGFYAWANDTLNLPSGPAEFMEEYNSPSAGTITDSVNFSSNLTFNNRKNTQFKALLPSAQVLNFPNSVSSTIFDSLNSSYFTVAYYETVDNQIILSTDVQAHFMPKPYNFTSTSSDFWTNSATAITTISYSGTKPQYAYANGSYIGINSNARVQEIEINPYAFPSGTWFWEIGLRSVKLDYPPFPGSITKENNFIKIKLDIRAIQNQPRHVESYPIVLYDVVDDSKARGVVDVEVMKK